MKATCVRDNKRLTKHVFLGVLLLFGVQLAFQIFTFFFLGDYKGGLINARMLLWDGLQTGPVQYALFHFLVIYLFILGILSAVSVLAARLLVGRLRIRESAAKLTILILLLLYASLMVLNLYHYPKSIVRLALVSEWQASENSLPYFVATTLFFVLVIAAALELLTRVLYWWRTRSSSARRIAAIGLVMILTPLVSVQFKPGFVLAQPPGVSAEATRPNVILIGLDSVRLDVIEDDELRESYMPNLDEFLGQSNTAWFTNAYTPIARTFPAWYALLAGKEPKNSGVRYNLQQLSPTQKSSTVARLLRESGYYTIYGSDEKRFSAIDESYGFSETLGPPPGAADWVMSFLEDTPVHNILRETRLAAFLFPFTYGNRASFTVYKPDHFVNLVNRRLAAYDHSQPLFLAIHLCLSHWPYAWSAGGAMDYSSNIGNYFDTLGPLDNQFGEIIAALKNTGLLENSVVVVFTDHGEALVSEKMEADDPRWKEFRTRLPEAADRTVGHGTDLLTVTQNKILISVQDNAGESGIEPGKNGRLTSLLDITPTIARIASLKDFETDGIDLASAIHHVPKNRVIYMETGFHLEALRQTDLDIEELVRQGASAYEITPDGLLQVRKDYHDLIIDSKQKGVTDGRFLLVSDPNALTEDGQGQALIAMDLAAPTQIISIEGSETNADVSYLSERLQQYYGEELSRH